MVDPLVYGLLEDAVNTSCKLTLVLLYAENTRLTATPHQLAMRLCRDPWSVETAIRELCNTGILDQRDGRIVYRPRNEWHAAILKLQAAYDDPFHRDEIARMVRDQEKYAPYRDELRNRSITMVAW